MCPQISVGADVGDGAVASVVLAQAGDRGGCAQRHGGCLGQHGEVGGGHLGVGGVRVADHGAVGINAIGGVDDGAAGVVGGAEVDHGLLGVQLSLRSGPSRWDRGHSGSAWLL